MPNLLPVHPKARTCKRQFNFTGHKLIHPFLAFLPFLFTVSEKSLNLQSLSIYVIFCLFLCLFVFFWPVNTHSAKLASNHSFTEENFSKNCLSLQSGSVEVGGRQGIRALFPSEAAHGYRQRKQPWESSSHQFLSLLNNSLSHPTAIMLGLKQWFYPWDGVGLKKSNFSLLPTARAVVFPLSSSCLLLSVHKPH